MKKKCKVVMLPTEKASRLYKAPWDEPPFIGYFNNPQGTIKGDTIAQHLYLISDDEIKEGDWYYDVIEKKIFQRTLPEDDQYTHDKKVIASTDKLLKSCTCGGRVNEEGKFYHKMGCNNKYYLPTFSEDFIKAYVNANGEIDEVNVEYEVVGIKVYGMNARAKKLKLRDDNTVIISQVKTMYSRDDMLSFAKYVAKVGFGLNHVESLFDKWNEENL